MDFLQSEWFMWVVMIIVFAGIIGSFLDGFESAGFDDGRLWGYTRKALTFLLGLALLPIIIPIMVFFRKD